jgi:hypothetical protein
MNLKLAVIVLVGIVVGMVLSVPTIFMSDVLVGGLMFGALTGVVGYFVLRRKEA